MARPALSQRLQRGRASLVRRRSRASRRGVLPDRGRRGLRSSAAVRPVRGRRRRAYRVLSTGHYRGHSYRAPDTCEATGGPDEALERLLRGPARDGFFGEADAFFHSGRAAGDVDGGASVQEDDVAGSTPLLAGEDATQDKGVQVGITAEETVWSVAGE